MFFFRNKHIMIDLGTGNNNKINWAIEDKQEFIDIVGWLSNISLFLVSKLIGRVPWTLGNPTNRQSYFDKIERNRLPWSTKRSWFGCLPKRLLHQISILIHFSFGTACLNSLSDLVLFRNHYRDRRN